jgi:hypothetical protein
MSRWWAEVAFNHNGVEVFDNSLVKINNNGMVSIKQNGETVYYPAHRIKFVRIYKK